MISVFATTTQKSYDWVRAIGEALYLDDTAAYIALRATLHALRDRLPTEEAVHLGAQLPMLLRGMYYDDWKPGRTPESLRDLPSFFQHVRARAGNLAIMDDTERLVRGVMGVLAAHVSHGELDDIAHILPRELATIIPIERDGAREKTLRLRSERRADRPVEREVVRELHPRGRHGEERSRQRSSENGALGPPDDSL